MENYLIEPVLRLVGKQVFIDYLGIFWIMLASALFICLSYIPHYSLFAKRDDMAIIISSGVGMIVGLVANVTLVPTYGLKGAAISTFCAMLTLLIIKAAFALMTTKVHLTKSQQ